MGQQNDGKPRIAQQAGLVQRFGSDLGLRGELAETTDVDLIPLNSADVGEAALEGEAAEEGHVAALPEELAARPAPGPLPLRPAPGGLALSGRDATADALARPPGAMSRFEIVQPHR